MDRRPELRRKISQLENELALAETDARIRGKILNCRPGEPHDWVLDDHEVTHELDTFMSRTYRAPDVKARYHCHCGVRMTLEGALL